MENKSKKIQSEISAGELLDKISILEIKLEKIKNKDSQIEIAKEYKMLKKAQELNIKLTDELNDNWFQGGMWDETRYRDKWRTVREELWKLFLLK